jgi:MFS family permease
MSEWSSWLALLVYAQDRGGSSAAGWTALGLLVPAIVVAPFVGRLADGPRPIRTLVLVYVGQASSLGIAAWLSLRNAPVLLVTVPAAVAIGGIAFVRPSFAVIAPGLVRTARELAVSNLLAGYCDSGAVLLGPIIATGFLALGGPELVLLVCAALGVIGIVATVPLLSHDRPAEPGTPTTQRTLRDVVSSVRSRRNVPALLLVLASQHVVMGFIGLMFVVIAVDELGMSGSGAGLLNIAFGLGAVCSAFFSTVFVGRGRIAPVVAACLAVSAASLLVLGGVTTLVVALAALPIAGLSRSLLDVLTRILLQRSAPPEYLATVFAFIEVLTSVGLATGTVLAQVTVATVGPRVGMMMLGVMILGVLALTVQQVRAADQSADVPVVVIALLRSNPVFAPLPPAALETVARSAIERHVEAGEVLIAQGEEGDRYFAIAAGEVDVTRDGVSVKVLRRGDGVGEVALLTDVRRTATVTAVQPTVVWEVDREPFLLAVTGHEPSRDAAWRHIRTFDD